MHALPSMISSLAKAGARRLSRAAPSLNRLFAPYCADGQVPKILAEVESPPPRRVSARRASRGAVEPGAERQAAGLRRSAAGPVRGRVRRSPARRDWRAGDDRIAEDAARARRPESARAAAVDAASAGAAGEVRGRTTVQGGFGIRPQGRSARGDPPAR